MVEQRRPEPRLGETVPVDRVDTPNADGEVGPVGLVADPDLPPPEIAAPPVVIAADHHDRKPAAQLRHTIERGSLPNTHLRARRTL